jgi:peptide/nickel transport system permease protein
MSRLGPGSPLASVLETAKLVLRKKSAVAGLAIILFYAFLGALADVITEHHYAETGLAADFAMPEWLAPPDVPRNLRFTFSTFEILVVEKEGEVTIEFRQLETGGFELLISGVGVVNVSIASRETLLYPYRPAKSMALDSAYSATNTSQVVPWYNIVFIVENVDLRRRGEVLELADNITIPRGIYVFYDEVKLRVFTPFPLVNEPLERSVSAALPNPILNRIQPYYDPKTMIGLIEGVNAARELLLERNTRLRVAINITYYCNPLDFLMRCSEAAGLKFRIEPVQLTVKGEAFGILGTNYMGADVWSQFVHGARSAVVLGVLVSMAIVLLGLMFGLIAGYKMGSLVDHALTFIIDVVYFIPLLPMVMVVGIVFGRSLFMIYLVLILLAWPGIARTIRHWTSAIRENLYVMAAKAIGASDLWIMTRYIAPQVIPYLVYGIVIGVPGVIMFEAAIQLIGFGDPEAPTWGRMISEAYWGGGFLHNAWWWFMPPIIGLVSLSLGFMMIGVALDEIVNPRLRR